MIKLQRMYWNDENKSQKSNTGNSLILPATFSITEVSTSKEFSKISSKFINSYKSENYMNKQIQINGTIYEDGSKSESIITKDEIMQYVNTVEKLYIKIYQNENDTRHWIGKLISNNITYERDRMLIYISLTFDLEEPFQLSDTLTHHTLTGTSGTVTNNSTVSFYPEMLMFYLGEVEGVSESLSIKPSYTSFASTITSITVEDEDQWVIYLKEFKGDVGQITGDFENLLEIPAGDFSYTKALTSDIELWYYERFL